MIPDETIRKFAEENGWREVFRSWNEHMLRQGRDIGNRTDSERLSSQDRELDVEVAFDVIKDFCVWLSRKINY